MIGQKKTLGWYLPRAAVTILAILFMLPLYIALVNAFKSSDAIVDAPLSLPWPATLENIKYVLTNPNVHIGRMYFNSAVITICGTVLCILVSSMAAYYLARSRKKKSSGRLYVFFLLGLMVPYVIVYVPLTCLMNLAGIQGNLLVLILVFVSGNISFSTFMFYGFIRSIPVELEEAAAIDGASSFMIFWKIVFPLLKPCTTTVAIFIGLSMWNDFMTPLLIGQVETITVGIYTAIGPYSANWGTVFAFVLFGSVPILIAYLCAQKQFISGLTAGAIKG